MFYHRGFCHDVEALHFKVVALCALFCLSTFGPCTMTWKQNPTGYYEYRTYKNDFISDSEDVLVGDTRNHIPPQTSIPKLSLENICSRVDLFCFPSTLSGFFLDSRSSEANVSEFSEVKADETALVGLMQPTDNYGSDENDTPSSVDHIEEPVRIKSRHVDDFSSPHVQISHPLLDWGQKYLHFPSLAFLTVENRHNDSVLNIFEPYSTNAQFYPCNYSEIKLKPGETASICFVFWPKWLGFSSGRLILQTSSGGFLIRTQGFAVESSYAIQPSVGPTTVSLLMENNGPDLLTVVKIGTVGENAESFRTKFVEGLILFPHTVTQVAMVTYTPIPFTNLNCKLLVQTNKSDAPELEISCSDIASLCLQSHLELKAAEMTKADESVLGNWRSQGTKNGMLVLIDSEITFPLVHVSTHQSKWIQVVNPSDQPVVMQLVLNSGEIINECRGSDEILQPSSSYTLLLNDHMAPSRYGFSIAQNALTEAYVHPHGKAVLGPIIFRPSSRCVWRSSALVRNNLSGVEWLSLHGSGGSISMVLLDGSDPVQTVKMKYNHGQPSVKVLFAKNVGDLPLKVNGISVSGTKCELDGFVVGSCKSFALQPGESRRLIISYRGGLCVAMVRRELELAMSGGILVLPMEVALPKPIFTMCKRSNWTRFKKFILLVLVSVFSICMGYSYRFLSKASSGHEEHSSDICLKPESSQIQANEVVEPEASKPDYLTVKTGKDKARRRKKKRNSGARLASQLEVSSSHSSNSTPSSPLSPLSSFAPKRSQELPSNVQTKNPTLVHPAKDKPLAPVKTMAPRARAPGAERKAARPVESSGGDSAFLYNIWDDHLRFVGPLQAGSIMPTIAEENNFCSLFSMSPQELFTASQPETVSCKPDD